ncbi:MAG: hypothetical protein ACJ8R9_31080 [Steroidobacteraceae bacterium]
MPVSELTEAQLTRVLAYAGLVLLGFELVKALIVKPIRAFYAHTTFGAGLPFKSYAEDVKSRHRDEFEACLLYLRDFMQAVDAADMAAIQALRQHRNVLAHDLATHLKSLNVDDYAPLLERADKALFKLSNYRVYIEIGSDPEFKNKGIDWNTVVGTEYVLFAQVRNKVRLLQGASASKPHLTTTGRSD